MAPSETITAHLYPWDVDGDPDAGRRLVDIGVTKVALAASYHAVRAATPHHPDHRVVEAPHGAVYVPVRPQMWEGHQIVPRSAGTWVGADSFVRAREALGNAGIRVAAWAVITHICASDGRFAGHEVRNAFGDRYTYALCPAGPEVRHYAATLVNEIVSLGGVDDLVLEAVGQLGIEHASAHEKTAGAGWLPTARALLSICFCTHCERLYAEAGADPATMRSDIVSALDDDGHATAVQEKLASVVPPIRTAASGRLLSEVVGRARGAGARHLTVFADPDQWVTGATITPPHGVDGVDRWLLPCFGDVEGDGSRAAALARLSPAPVSAYVNLLTDDFAETVDARLSRLDRAGVSAIHGYHYGLASRTRIDTMTAAFERSPFSKGNL